VTEESKKPGTLTVVGTGIKFLSHVTLETPAFIEQADRVLHAVPDVATRKWIQGLNSSAEEFCYYLPDQPRKATYEKWIERIIECVAAGEKVCVIFYGHPGVFAYSSHEAIRRAREFGFEAQMLPGISASDTLFADIGLDPAVSGMQSYEATDFLIRPRAIDTSTGLLIWQGGVVGELGYKHPDGARARRQVLADTLVSHYGPDHEVVLYVGATLSMFDPVIKRVRLSELADTDIETVTTIYIPPKQRAELDLDAVDRLGIPRDQLDAFDVGPSEVKDEPAS